MHVSYKFVDFEGDELYPLDFPRGIPCSMAFKHVEFSESVSSDGMPTEMTITLEYTE